MKILDVINSTLSERENNYDHPKPNFERIAGYWNTFLKDKLAQPITASDVAMLMVLMKVAREQHKHTQDNLVDMVGYTLCAERIIDFEAEQQVAKPKTK